MRPGLFLDRDGTLIVESHFLRDPDEVRLIPGAAEAVYRFQQSGYAPVLVSNQSGVARGYFGEETVKLVNDRVVELLQEQSVELAGIYFCPHLPDGAVAEYAIECDCRKPAIGMWRRAGEELGIDLRSSWTVGDKASDVFAGMTAGTRTALVLTGYGKHEREMTPPAAKVYDDLAAFADAVL